MSETEMLLLRERQIAKLENHVVILREALQRLTGSIEGAFPALIHLPTVSFANAALDETANWMVIDG